MTPTPPTAPLADTTAVKLHDGTAVPNWAMQNPLVAAAVKELTAVRDTADYLLQLDPTPGKRKTAAALATVSNRVKEAVAACSPPAEPELTFEQLMEWEPCLRRLAADARYARASKPAAVRVAMGAGRAAPVRWYDGAPSAWQAVAYRMNAAERLAAEPTKGRSEHSYEPGHNQKPRTVTQDAARCRLRPTGALRQARLPLCPRTRPPRLLSLLAGRRPAAQVLRPTRRPGGGSGGLRRSPTGTPGAFGSVATVAATGGRRAGGVVLTEVATTPAAPSEAGELAGELGKSFGRLVQLYEKHYSLSREEAVQRATEPMPDGDQQALSCPPDQVTWIDLHMMALTDPDRSTARWEEVKRAALDEVRTGHRAAKAVEVGTLNEGAWQRAQFLALREELSAEWQPRNGIERQLLDTMAQAQANYLTWMQTLTNRTVLASCTNDRRLKDEGRWQPPQQSDADAIDQAAGMMDRFNRIFLRTLRALCDMRRHSTPVIVQNGGQMNVAQQQVNLNTATSAGA